MAHPAANLKGMDLVKWLNTKLGDPQSHWCSRQAAGVLSKDVIVELSSCFNALDMHAKLKLVQSILYLSPKLLEMWREPLENILHIAQQDTSEWVRVMAELYSCYPARKYLKHSSGSPRDNFTQTVQELASSLSTAVSSLNNKIVPENFVIATPQTTKMMYGYTGDEPKQHFKLRKAPRSKLLMEEALKTADALRDPSTHKKAPVTSYVSSLPIRMRNNQRKMDVSLPMRGIKSVNPAKLSAGFSNEPKKFQRTVAKREGGAMLLDISDLPQAHVKKRRADPKPVPATEEPKEPKKRGRKTKAEKEAELKAAEDAKTVTEPTEVSEVKASEALPEQITTPTFQGFGNNMFDTGYQTSFSPFFQPNNNMFQPFSNQYQPQIPTNQAPQITIPQQSLNFPNFTSNPSPSFPEGFFGNDIQ
ncbi:unnamed protein product [Bursaphelenchus okinawaensis]|uniref:HDAg domain-containing protein n=1 Tax=Bursaphelenchus okinawaensis TaxID=465554 RepID=A0A811L741_9BILA|nr:unnamed protein product [Bursaphelenchus okinawaensis]CAG9119499.1 unnamed protein product [Bursaphelenchus okinawaensis]